MLVMSKAVFDKLTPAEQALFRTAAKESVAFQRQKWDEQTAKAIDTVTKAGSVLVKDVNKAEFQAAMKPVYEKFMTTPDLQRLVKAVQDTK
jgi:TRAP-type C4-dicarboxylate transport system substrate-binding protein